MPFVEHRADDPILPRHSASQAEIDASLLWVRQQQSQVDFANQVIGGALILLACIAAAIVYRRRHRLAAVADRIAVKGGAFAIKGARRSKQSWGNFWRRAKAAADR